MLSTYKVFVEVFFKGCHNMSNEELNNKIRESDTVFGSFKDKILISEEDKKNTQNKLIEKLEEMIENSTFEVFYKFFMEHELFRNDKSVKWIHLIIKIDGLRKKFEHEQNERINEIKKDKEEKQIELGILDVRKNIEDFERRKKDEIEELERRIKEVKKREHDFDLKIKDIEEKTRSYDEAIEKINEDVKDIIYNMTREEAQKIFDENFEKLCAHNDRKENKQEKYKIINGVVFNKYDSKSEEFVKNFRYVIRRLSIKYQD